MNEVILKLLQKLEENMGIVIDYTRSDIIPYAHDLMERYLRYAMVYEIVKLVLGIGMLGLSIYILVMLFKDKNKEKSKFFYYDGDLTDMGNIAIIVGASLFVFGLFGTVFKTLSIVEILMIPEIYLYNTLM